MEFTSRSLNDFETYDERKMMDSAILKNPVTMTENVNTGMELILSGSNSYALTIYQSMLPYLEEKCCITFKIVINLQIRANTTLDHSNNRPFETQNVFER